MKVEPMFSSTGLLSVPRSTRMFKLSRLNVFRKFFENSLATSFFSVLMFVFLFVRCYKFLLSISSFFLALPSSNRCVSISSASLSCKVYFLCFVNSRASNSSITSIRACSIDFPTKTYKIGSTSFS